MRIRDSFRFRLMMWLVGINVLVFSLVFAVNAHYVTEDLTNDLNIDVWSKMDYLTEVLDADLAATEVSAQNLLGLSRSPFLTHKRDSVFSHLELYLQANPHVQGIAIGYNPSQTAQPARGFCPYVMRMPDGTFKRLDVAEVRDYFNYDWYKNTVSARQGRWCKPLHEPNGSLIAGYEVPMFDEAGDLYAVLDVSNNMDDLNDILQQAKPYPTALISLIDVDGNIIAHPKNDHRHESCVLATDLKDKDGVYSEVRDSIMKGGRGTITYDHPELGKTYVLHNVLSRTGWTIVLEVPECDISPGLLRMERIQFVLAVVGILLMVVVMLLVIRRQSKPVLKFAEAARNITQGDYNLKLEEPKKKNEFYDLHRAFSSMCTSITQHIAQLQEQREIAEKAQKVAERANEMKGEFILNMMHEVRTPLNQIKGFSSIIADPSSQTDPAILQEASAQISTSTGQLTHLLDDILLLGKYDAMDDVETAPANALEILLTAMMNSPQSDPTKVEMVPVFSDADAELVFNTHMDMAQKALSILVGNAVKFTPEGTIRMGLQVTDSEVRYYVEDTGIGIPAGEEKRIFERFVKLDEFVPGTGLGLSLAEAIVKVLRGRVYVDTAYAGPGARFVIDLPR